MPDHHDLSFSRSVCTLLDLLAEDVGVTSVKDGHGGATEELTAGGTELNLYEGKKRLKVSSQCYPPERTGLAFAGLERPCRRARYKYC